jgi:hypothetical protein
MPLIGSLAACPDLRVLFGMGTPGGLTDGQLLERFASHRDEAGEMAFAALLDRHGPMVLRTCASLLRDPNDAEDAFQATFLVGLTHDQAAQRLGWPVGTVRSRLSRGRDRLRRRLDERGAAPAVAPLMLASACRAGAAIRPSLAVATARKPYVDGDGGSRDGPGGHRPDERSVEDHDAGEAGGPLAPEQTLVVFEPETRWRGLIALFLPAPAAARRLRHQNHPERPTCADIFSS